MRRPGRHSDGRDRPEARLRRPHPSRIATETPQSLEEDELDDAPAFESELELELLLESEEPEESEEEPPLSLDDPLEPPPLRLP